MPPLQCKINKITCVKHMSLWNPITSFDLTALIAPSLSVFLVAISTEAKRTKRPFLGERTFPELVFVVLEQNVSNNIWYDSDITQSNIRSFWCFIHVSLKKVFYRKRWSTRGKNNKRDYLFMHIFLSLSVDNVGVLFLFWTRVVPICQQQQSVKSCVSKFLECSPSLIKPQSCPQSAKLKICQPV